MDILWYYLEGEERRGPMSFEELVRALVVIQDARGVYVWNEGMTDWVEAGTVPEISQRLPPPRSAASPPSLPPVPSYQPQPFQSYQDPNRFAVVQDAEAIAVHYRRLVLLVGCQLLLGCIGTPVQAAIASTEWVGVLVSVIYLLLLLLVWVMTIGTAYKLAGHLGESAPIVWAILMFIPCANLIVLLLLSSKATDWCRRHGIRVGLLGPTRESIEELRRRISTSAFD